MTAHLKKRILCVFPSPNTINKHIKSLEKEKYFVYIYTDIIQAKGQIYNDPPDIILLSTEISDWKKFLNEIKKDSVYRHLPVLLILPSKFENKILTLCHYPFDDWLFENEPFSHLLLRIKMKEIHAASYLDANPLTRLPGNYSIKTNIQKQIDNNNEFGLGYIDIDNFKAFNDKYGFSRGDDMIRMTARIMINVIHRSCSADGFVGHVGGDDFVFIVPAGFLETCCQQIIQNFDLVSSTVSDDEDRIRGYIICEDRQGNERKFPLPTLSIACINSQITKIYHSGEAAAIAGEVKKLVKQKAGSNYFINRRISKKISKGKKS